MLIVVVLALGAAVFNALSSVFQRVAARDAPSEDTLRVALVAYVLRRPAFFAGMACMICAFVCQAAALGEGTLSVVQPVLVTELLFVLAILVVRFHVPVGRLEWGGACATVVGLGGFLAAARPLGGRTNPSLVSLGATGLGVVVVVAVALLTARRGTSAGRAALFGVAAGATFGLTAAIIKLFTDEIAGRGLGAALATWPPYALMVTGVAAVFFAQNAYQAGPLTASQPALTITDPVISVVIGVSLFGDHLASGSGDVALEVTAFLVMAAGIVMLGVSPHMTSSEFGGPEVAGPGRREDLRAGGGSGAGSSQEVYRA